MFVIQETQVEETVADVNFACDLKACKGACCTLPGGRGAPLLDKEIHELRKAFPSIKKYLSEDHLQKIDEAGLYEGSAGDYVTPCYDNRACVFVTYEEGIAKCSFEKAYFNGEISWRKPLSCHLFPLRIDSGNPKRIRLEHLPECASAAVKGYHENIRLTDFLKDALIRSYGEGWYREFLHACELARTGRTVGDERGFYYHD